MKYYKLLLLGLAIILSVQTAWAQSDRKEQRKIEKAERKRLKKEARERNQELVKELVKDKSYVLEAFTIAGRYHQQQVSSNINFVKVEGNKLTLQTGNNFMFGYNGLGGITINGTIREYEIREEKNGVSAFIRFTDPLLGFSTLTLDVGRDGFARARVLDNRGRNLTFQGQLVSLEESRVYQGMPVI